jgi:chromosome partitioning protein
MTVCALEVATHLLVPVRPDRFSVLGLELGGFKFEVQHPVQ